jgi:Flp pilus assembly protein TadD
VEIEHGRVLFAQGRIDESVRQLRTAVASIAPEETRQQASARLALGKAFLAKGECASAIENLRDAHRLRAQAMPAQNWFIYEAENALGDALSRCGQHEEARARLEHSVMQLRKLRGKDDFKLAEAERALAAHARRTTAN